MLDGDVVSIDVYKIVAVRFTFKSSGARGRRLDCEQGAMALGSFDRVYGSPKTLMQMASEKELHAGFLE